MALPAEVEKAEIGDRIQVPLDRKVSAGVIKSITPGADGVTLDVLTDEGRIDYHVPSGQTIIHIC